MFPLIHTVNSLCLRAAFGGSLRGDPSESGNSRLKPISRRPTMTVTGDERVEDKFVRPTHLAEYQPVGHPYGTTLDTPTAESRFNTIESTPLSVSLPRGSQTRRSHRTLHRRTATDRLSHDRLDEEVAPYPVGNIKESQNPGFRAFDPTPVEEHAGHNCCDEKRGPVKRQYRGIERK